MGLPYVLTELVVTVLVVEREVGSEECSLSVRLVMLDLISAGADRVRLLTATWILNSITSSNIVLLLLSIEELYP